MKIKIKKAKNKDKVYDISDLVSSVSWEGSASQCSRKVEVSYAVSVHDKEFPSINVSCGDILYLYENSQQLFIGRIVNNEITTETGTRSLSAVDYMNILLGSNVTLNIKNQTAEAVSKKVCKSLGISTGTLVPTNVAITKWLVENESGYNVILGCYTKARKKTKKLYRLCMDGIKVCVKEKNEATGVTLTLKDSIVSSALTENAESIVNKIIIVDEKNKKISEVSDKKSIALFGVYQDIYQKEKGVNSKQAASAMIQGAEKEIKIEAVGDIRCVSGKSIIVKDDITGLSGKFWIEEDSHSFEGTNHTMSLTLSFERLMEEFEEEQTAEEKKKKWPKATKDSVCYYSTTSEKYHSKTKCGSGLVFPIKSTVAETEKTGRGKCSRCWQ